MDEDDERGYRDRESNHHNGLYSRVFFLRRKALKDTAGGISHSHDGAWKEEHLLDRVAHGKEISIQYEKAAQQVANSQGHEEAKGDRLNVFEGIFHEDILPLFQLPHKLAVQILP